MALVRCNVFCVSMLLLCLAINWNLSQRQAALRGREDESVAEALGELGRLASDTTVKGTPNVHLPRRAAPARTPLLSGLGGHARLDDTSKLSKLSKEINSTLSSPQQAGMATWMDGISRTSQPPQASMDHPINTTATLLRRHRRSSPMGDSRKERASALARAVTEGLHQRVSALRKSATLDRIGLGSLMHSRREVEQGKHQKVHVPLEDNGRGTIELQQDDIRPIPTETVTYEKQRQVTKRADNFHNLITASRGRVSG